MDIVAIIPARGGSKGIPNKNIINIAGKPLLSWSIESAQKSRLINKVVVSSDSPKILSVAQEYNSEIIKRPKKYSGDATPSNLVDILRFWISDIFDIWLPPKIITK